MSSTFAHLQDSNEFFFLNLKAKPASDSTITTVHTHVSLSLLQLHTHTHTHTLSHVRNLSGGFNSTTCGTKSVAVFEYLNATETAVNFG